MASYEHLDALLGQALECLTAAASQVRALPLEPAQENLLRVGDAVLATWEVRGRLYAARPEVRRDLVAESEADPARLQALAGVHASAVAAEREGRAAEAQALFQRLLAEARFGFFRLCAEAGLYRLSGQGKT